MRRVRVLVKCSECAKTLVSLDDVTLRRCAEDESWSYRFTCPICRRTTSSPIDTRTAFDAIMAGAPLEDEWPPAAELEPRERPPLTLADLREFHELLDQPDWFSALARLDREGRPRSPFRD